MAKMTQNEIEEHNKNPNILLYIGDQKTSYRCSCGCNVFHHKDDWNIFICNACGDWFEGE